jgi:hypothetical protein
VDKEARVDKPKTEYKKPEVHDYGSLQDLTAASAAGGVTDVPKGTPGPNVFS